MNTDAEFRNWLSQPEHKEDYVSALHQMQDEGVKPGLVRWLMERAFEAGAKATEAE